MKRSCLAGCIVLTVLLLWSLPAAAETDVKRAKLAIEKVQAAVALQKQSRHLEAIGLFDAAWALSPHPKVLFFKTRSLMALERFEEALSDYRLIQKNAHDLEPEKLREVQKNVGICEEALRKTAVLIRTPGVDGAEVQVDGKPAGSSPVKVDLRKGSYRVRVSKAGFVATERALTVAGQTSLIVDVPLAAITLAKKEAPKEEAPKKDTSPLSASARRTWAWVTLGTGLATFGSGLGFLGNYTQKAMTDLEPDEEMQGQTVDLALGGVLAGVGVGLLTTSIVLFWRDGGEKEGLKTTFAPLPEGGFTVGLSGRW